MFFSLKIIDVVRIIRVTFNIIKCINLLSNKKIINCVNILSKLVIRNLIIVK